MKSIIKQAIEEKMPQLELISKSLYENPELGGVEYFASNLLINMLKVEGFAVDIAPYQISTAFIAKYVGQKSNQNIAFLCEYDALPELGHGCGHNLIAAMSVGAALGLKSVIDKVGGCIYVFGTPAEETNGAKVKMTTEGAFNLIDIALMVHPSPISEESGTSLALTPLQFEYQGKTSHAAASPEKGINSLEAALLTFNNVNALRQYMPSDVRIHGVVIDGGRAANIIPDYAKIQFYVRAAKKEVRDTYVARVIKCAESASEVVGTVLTTSHFEESYDDLVTNAALSELFSQNLLELGEPEIAKPSNTHGSVDIGNISQVIPVIHPWLSVGDADLVIHTKKFAEHTQSDQAIKAIERGASALANTAYDYLSSLENQAKVKSAFKNK